MHKRIVFIFMLDAVGYSFYPIYCSKNNQIKLNPN